MFSHVFLIGNMAIGLFQVTIHNINDPKFSRKSASVNLSDGVEITRINGPDNFTTNPNLAVGSQRPTATADNLNNSASSEYGGNILLNLIIQHKI